MYRKKNVKQETETSVSVSQSETSVENEQTFSSLTTNAPDVEDTSTQDSQEADIEVQHFCFHPYIRHHRNMVLHC